MRTRVLKPDFYMNEEIAHCEPLARILYTGLWCFADKFGVFQWRPLKIKARVFPFDTCKVEPLLEQLLKQELIFQYSVNGEIFGIIPTFLKHQKPHRDEKKSGFPLPPENLQKSSEKVKSAYRYINRYSFKNIKNDKQKFGEFENVLLKPEEHEKLTTKLGEEETTRLIENLSEYIHSKGKRYKSHYATILQWSKRDKKAGDSFGI
jgi:hypothetical protein